MLHALCVFCWIVRIIPVEFTCSNLESFYLVLDAEISLFNKIMQIRQVSKTLFWKNPNNSYHPLLQSGN